MFCSHPCYQPSLFDLAVGLPKSDLFEQLFVIISHCTKQRTHPYLYYVFNKEPLCSCGRKIKYKLSANYETYLFSASVSPVGPFFFLRCMKKPFIASSTDLSIGQKMT